LSSELRYGREAAASGIFARPESAQAVRGQAKPSKSETLRPELRYGREAAASGIFARPESAHADSGLRKTRVDDSRARIDSG